MGFFFVKHVELVQHQPARFVVEFFVVFAQFVDDGEGFFGGVEGFVEKGPNRRRAAVGRYVISV